MVAVSSASSPGPDVIRDLVANICARGRTAPDAVAVRFGGDTATFGQLASLLRDYDDMLERHGMSEVSAFYAALCGALPALVAVGPPSTVIGVVSEVAEWLTRSVDDESDSGDSLARS